MSFDFNRLGSLAGAAVGNCYPETGGAISSIFANKPAPPAPAPAAQPIFQASNAQKSAPVVAQGGIPLNYLLGAGAVVGLVVFLVLIRK